MWDLFRLFALFTMEADSYECKCPDTTKWRLATHHRIVFSTGVVNREQLDKLPARVHDLMTQIRPHAVKLVDSWMIPDYLLDRYVSC